MSTPIYYFHRHKKLLALWLKKGILSSAMRKCWREVMVLVRLHETRDESLMFALALFYVVLAHTVFTRNIQVPRFNMKLFSCSVPLSMKFSLLINMKMPTIVVIFIFISREIFIYV